MTTKVMLKKLFLLFAVLFAGFYFTACSSDDDDLRWTDSELYHKLVGTSWQKYNEILYWDNGSIAEQGKPKVGTMIYTFTDMPFERPWQTRNQWYVLEMYDSETDETKTDSWFLKGDRLNSIIIGDIILLNSEYLQVRFDFDDEIDVGCDYSIDYYKRVSTPGGGVSGGSTGDSTGSSTSYEEPEIGFDDVTLNRKSMTVKFRIYNKDRAGVTYAIGYYGTSSPSHSVSASISGSIVTMKITGLSPDTDYRVKCTVMGKGGSTSETVFLSTLP